MKRTISVMVGKGSVRHNSREFHAKNTDPARSDQNIHYCNTPIRQVYHTLFDDALERYNAKQTREDRRISDYYEKIRSGKQEKPFHEVILQIGDKDNMNALDENGQLAKVILDEYYRDFQERNPYLRVFSAHLHMDEATPHIHIDFVPFTTGSKRGLDTRVSLKQALNTQGFRGGTRHETEWAQWVQAEKEQLAAVMARHGVEWEHRDSHEKHLSVYDFEKKMRAREVAELTETAREKAEAVKILEDRLSNYDAAKNSISEMKQKLKTDPDYQLPEPTTLMSAKTYKSKFADVVVERLKQLIIGILARYFKVMDDYMRVNRANGNLYRENEYLREENQALRQENDQLREQSRSFSLLQRVFGAERINALVGEAQERLWVRDRHHISDVQTR